MAERGQNLSQGQRQLLAFARVLAADPEILVLDEATASIDTETEQLIQDALDRLTAGRTSILIAHRLQTVQKADRVLVMDQSRVAELGTHAELLAKGGLYHRLHTLQFQDAQAFVLVRCSFPLPLRPFPFAPSLASSPKCMEFGEQASFAGNDRRQLPAFRCFGPHIERPWGYNPSMAETQIAKKRAKVPHRPGLQRHQGRREDAARRRPHDRA